MLYRYVVYVHVFVNRLLYLEEASGEKSEEP